eukprot:5347481-Amphidinium_carterae.1
MSGGWFCLACKKQYKWQVLFCYFCKKENPQDEGPGRPVLPTLADAMEALLKAQWKLAQDAPAQLCLKLRIVNLAGP